MKLTEFVDKMDRTKAMELLEYLEETDDELRLKVAELLMDGHLCELTATRRIERMKATFFRKSTSRSTSHRTTATMH